MRHSSSEHSYTISPIDYSRGRSDTYSQLLHICRDCRKLHRACWPVSACDNRLSPALGGVHYLPMAIRLGYKLSLMKHYIRKVTRYQYRVTLLYTFTGQSSICPPDTVQTVAATSTRPGLCSAESPHHRAPRTRTKFGQRS